MSKINENAPCIDARNEDLIVLGVASVETKGMRAGFEGVGGNTPSGISDE